MGTDVDEDLIEATIRRVAESRAARGDADVPDELKGEVSGRVASVDEDAIEATIRRVAEAKAAQALDAEPDAEPDRGPGDDADEAIEATIRRVAEANAARLAESDRVEIEMPADAGDEDAIEAAIRVAEATAGQTAESQPTGPLTSHADGEDAIEETIRRVAQSNAARLAESTSALAPAPDDDDEDPIEATIRRVAEAKAARVAVSSPDNASAADVAAEGAIKTTIRRIATDQAARAGLAPRAGDDDVDDGDASGAPLRPEAEAIERLQAELVATNHRLDTVSARVDALTAALDGITQGPEVPMAKRATIMPPNDDDWDDTPQPPRILSGRHPRPAIMRDPSPMTATAEALVDANAEPQVAPTPFDSRRLGQGATARAEEATVTAMPEAKRGFDLLPKTYRITVEDKRRGVDLVPLHRALLAMDGVKDMSLLSYSNGVAIVSVQTENGMDPDALNRAVARAMAREVRVEVHNDTTMVVKLAED